MRAAARRAEPSGAWAGRFGSWFVAGAVWLSLAPPAGAHAPAWWHALPPADPAPAALPAPRWYDAIDVRARVTTNMSGPEVRAGLTVRLRLDAETYLGRLGAEADDLDALSGALVRQRNEQARLQWLADRCQGSWRAWQRDLIDAALARAEPPEDDHTGPRGEGASAAEMANDIDSLHVLRELVSIGAERAATADDMRACRLEHVLAQLTLALEHPALVAAAAERRLAERASALLAAAQPPVVWLDANARSGPLGAAAGLRVGLDLPLVWPGAGLELAADTTGESLQATLSYQRSGAAARPRPAPPRDPLAGDDAALTLRLHEQLRLRRLEAALLGIEARQQWLSACGEYTPEALVACLTRAFANRAALEQLLLAIDRERAAVGATLAAIEASGQDVAHLLELPPSGSEEGAAAVP